MYYNIQCVRTCVLVYYYPVCTCVLVYYYPVCTYLCSCVLLSSVYLCSCVLLSSVYLCSCVLLSSEYLCPCVLLSSVYLCSCVHRHWMLPVGCVMYTTTDLFTNICCRQISYYQKISELNSQLRYVCTYSRTHQSQNPLYIRTLYVLCELCEVLVHCTNVMSVTLGFNTGC